MSLHGQFSKEANTLHLLLFTHMVDTVQVHGTKKTSAWYKKVHGTSAWYKKQVHGTKKQL